MPKRRSPNHFSNGKPPRRKPNRHRMAVPGIIPLEYPKGIQPEQRAQVRHLYANYREEFMQELLKQAAEEREKTKAARLAEHYGQRGEAA